MITKLAYICKERLKECMWIFWAVFLFGWVLGFFSQKRRILLEDTISLQK